MQRATTEALAAMVEKYEAQQALYDALGINDQLTARSAELTRMPPPKPGRYKVISDSNKVLRPKSEQEFFQKWQDLLDKKQLKRATLFSPGQPPDKVYFPSQAILEKYGVTGIVQYNYPANRHALADLVENLPGDVKPVGDFK